MEDRAVIEPSQRRRRGPVDPLDGEAVGLKGRVLRLELVPLGWVGCQAEAADAAERVTCERLEPVERALGELPEQACALGAELGAGAVVRPGCAAEREASVPAARAAGDFTRLVQAHAQPAPARASARRSSP